MGSFSITNRILKNSYKAMQVFYFFSFLFSFFCQFWKSTPSQKLSISSTFSSVSVAFSPGCGSHFPTSSTVCFSDSFRLLLSLVNVILSSAGFCCLSLKGVGNFSGRQTGHLRIHLIPSEFALKLR